VVNLKYFPITESMENVNTSRQLNPLKIIQEAAKWIVSYTREARKSKRCSHMSKYQRF